MSRNIPYLFTKALQNVLANKFRKPETLIIRQRQTHSNNINNKVPFQRCYSMCLPVASATKNTPGNGLEGMEEEMTASKTSSCGQAAALPFTTAESERKGGWGLCRQRKIARRMELLKNTGKVGHL